MPYLPCLSSSKHHAVCMGMDGLDLIKLYLCYAYIRQFFEPDRSSPSPNPNPNPPAAPTAGRSSSRGVGASYSGGGGTYGGYGQKQAQNHHQVHQTHQAHPGGAHTTAHARPALHSRGNLVLPPIGVQQPAQALPASSSYQHPQQMHRQYSTTPTRRSQPGHAQMPSLGLHGNQSHHPHHPAPHSRNYHTHDTGATSADLAMASTAAATIEPHRDLRPLQKVPRGLSRSSNTNTNGRHTPRQPPQQPGRFQHPGRFESHSSSRSNIGYTLGSPASSMRTNMRGRAGTDRFGRNVGISS